MLGFAFGIAQMIMFFVYRKTTKKAILLEYSRNDLIRSTNMVAAPFPANDDMTVAIVIKSLIQLKEGDAKKTSETNDRLKQDMSKGTASKTATAFGLILRRTSI